MKLSVVLFVVLVASVCANDDEEAHKKKMQESMQKCVKESGASIEELKECHEKKKNCPKMNCFEACMMREDGLINKDGTIVTQTIDKLVAGLATHGHPKTSAAVKKCFKNPPKKMSFCDIGHTINVCMEKEPHD